MFLNLPKSELAEISNNINRWEWDVRLGGKPENWDAMPDFNLSEHYKLPTKYKILKPYQVQIKKKIGEKECLRWHHLNNLGRTNFQFEIFWLKSCMSKLFRTGLYSPKFKKLMREVLGNIAEKNHKDWIDKNYHNGK